MEKTRSIYAPIVVRIGIAVVFVWFGISQLHDPSAWVGWVPPYAHGLPVSLETIVKGNGFFELIFGVLLAVGLGTRVVAIVLALHMAHIVTIVGYTDIGIRDFGLLTAAVSVALFGRDALTLDQYFFTRHTRKDPFP